MNLWHGLARKLWMNLWMNPRKDLKRRALVFTVDSIIAIVAVFSILLAVVFLLRGVGSGGPVDEERLHLAALDSGQLLESAGSLAVLASGQRAQVQEYLDALDLCADVELQTLGGERADYVIRTGCEESRDAAPAIGLARRVITRGDTDYLVVVRAWYDE